MKLGGFGDSTSSRLDDVYCEANATISKPTHYAVSSVSPVVGL
jgi:hypothetical protein